MMATDATYAELVSFMERTCRCGICHGKVTPDPQGALRMVALPYPATWDRPTVTMTARPPSPPISQTLAVGIVCHACDSGDEGMAYEITEAIEFLALGPHEIPYDVAYHDVLEL